MKRNALKTESWGTFSNAGLQVPLCFFERRRFTLGILILKYVVFNYGAVLHWKAKWRKQLTTLDEADIWKFIWNFYIVTEKMQGDTILSTLMGLDRGQKRDWKTGEMLGKCGAQVSGCKTDHLPPTDNVQNIRVKKLWWRRCIKYAASVSTQIYSN